MAERVLAVLYASKSTQDRHQSLMTQSVEAREMAAENGWEVVAEHADQGFSAYSGNRGPGLEAAKRAAIDAAKRAGVPVMLVAQAHDRFARGAGDRPGAAQSLGELWHELRRLNVWLRTVEDDEELRDEATVAAIGRRAHLDSLRKSRSVKKGMRRRAQKGLLAGGPRPFGYEWAGGRGEKRLQVIPVEAEIVIRIFTDTGGGASQMQIARSLNTDQVKTVTGKPWIQGTVHALVSNVLYRGDIKHDGAILPGVHQPIVDKDLWEAAAAVRIAAGRTTGRGGGRSPRGSHLFTHGLLRCGLCGGALLPRTDPNRRQAPTETYMCSTRRTDGPDACAQEPIERAAVDAAFFDSLVAVHVDLEATRARLAARIAADGERAAEALAEAEGERLAAQARYERVLAHYQEGRLTPEDWSGQRPGLEAGLEAADAALERAREHAANAESILAPDAESLLLHQLAELRDTLVGGMRQPVSVQAVRRLVGQLFERVEYHGCASEGWWKALEPVSNTAVSARFSAILVPFVRGDRDPLQPRAVLPLTATREGLVT